MMNKYSLILYITLFISCDTISQDRVDSSYDKSIIPYDLNNPTEEYNLPKQLEEISGLAWAGEQIAAMNDEDGIVFILSKEGEIVSNYQFGDGDDYEGIAAAGESIFVVNSSGDLFQTSKASNKSTNKFETALNGDNDVEGLEFDKNNNRLLVACKEEAGIGEDLKGRAIYAFDLASNQLSDKPVLVINNDQIKEHLSSTNRSTEMKSFAPSGLAIQPGTGNIYVISHPAKSLLVFSASNELLEVVPLSSKIYKQAEGICFSPEGTLYISNEGDGGRANILRFDPN